MKTLEHINRQQPKILNKSLKRKKVCKFTKGEHNFKICIPKMFKNIDKFKNMSIHEFYKYYNEDRIFILGKYEVYFYECSLCGKQKTGYEWNKKLSTV